MLKAEIKLSDLVHAPSWDGDQLLIGQSRIRPFSHAALEVRLVRSEAQWFLVVRERWTGDGRSGAGEVFSCHVADEAEFARLYRVNLAWPLDYLMIEAAQDGCRLRIRAGALGVAPVYCMATRDSVSLTWDFADFLSRPLMIDPAVASRLLSLRAGYSAQHICSGVNVLTERSVLFLEPGSARYQYPSPVAPPVPAATDGEDDTVGRFGEILRQGLCSRPLIAGQVVLELSGGMDSAAVACAFADVHGRFSSKGVLVGRELGRAQAERRNLIVDRLGLRDATIEMEEFLPSLDLQPRRARPEYMYPEFYREAFEQLWDQSRGERLIWLMTGVGGDELFPRYQGEGGGDAAVVVNARDIGESLLTRHAAEAAQAMHVFDAPQGIAPASTLIASICQAPLALRRGLWPVTPLSAPDMVTYCYSLPTARRRHRDTMRRFLGARLREDVFPENYKKETFSHVLPHLIAQQATALREQLDECALSDLGLVDRKKALTLLDDVAQTKSEAATASLVSFLWIERFVRQFG